MGESNAAYFRALQVTCTRTERQIKVRFGHMHELLPAFVDKHIFLASWFGRLAAMCSARKGMTPEL